MFTLLGIKRAVPKSSTTEEEVSCFYGKKIKTNGRMDLIIKAPPYLFVIENKIRHKLDNPLDTYRKWIENNYFKNENFTEKYYVVLGLNKPKEDLKNFKFISHHALVTEILKYKSELSSTESTHLTPFIEDYFRAMTNMKTELSNEENQILEFCINNFEKLDQIQNFKQKIVDIFESNLIKITQEIDIFDNCKIYKDIANNWNDVGVYSDSQYFFVNDWAFILQINYRLEGVHIYLTPSTKRHKKSLDNDNFSQFLKFLKSLNIKFKECEPLGDEFYVELLALKTMEQNAKIIKKINDIILKIVKIKNPS